MRAIAATVVSAIVFSAMLLANATVYSAENTYLSAVELTSAQVQERGYGSILIGLAAYSSLAHAQSYLSSRPMDCSDLQSYIASIDGIDTLSGNEGALLYSSNSSWKVLSTPLALPGDASLPSEFDGYMAGVLDLEVADTVNESYLGGLPIFSESSLEVVHLQVQPLLAAAQCLSALAELRSSLLTGDPCNSSTLARDVSTANSRYPLLNSYQVGASTGKAGADCTVEYWVRTTQTGVLGVSGTFQWTVFGSGSLSVSTGPPPVSTSSST